MLGSVLAVMLAGAAYVPLDPRHPRERLETVLEDAGAAFLLTTRDLALRTTAQTLRVTEPLAAGSVTLPALPAEDALAYVIYTSGTTGRPKGVAVGHAALTNLLRSIERTPGLSKDDTLVAITTLAFDIAGLELLSAAAHGCKVWLSRPMPKSSTAGSCWQLLDRAGRESEGATVLQATPGAWRLLLDAGWQAVRRAAAAQGALRRRSPAPAIWPSACSNAPAEVWNMYGPTETTIWSSATRVHHRRTQAPLRLGATHRQHPVLRARLAPSTRPHRRYRRALPRRSQGLAQGYWRRPELTTEKFIPNPFAARAGTPRKPLRHRRPRAPPPGRLPSSCSDAPTSRSKCADTVSNSPEIEAALTQHPQVKEAVVLQQKSDATGVTRLAAYVASGFAAEDPRATVIIAALPGLLARTLPDYMVPQSFAVVPDLPRTPNGKVDRKALPGLQFQDTLRTFTPPSTPTQQRLADIWTAVLEITSVSIHDSIFELGADSLIIFRIAARAQREGLRLNATQIFQYRTVAALCDALEDTFASAPVRVTTRITAASRDPYKLDKVRVDAQIH